MTEANGDTIKEDIYQSDWEIIACSHPELVVLKKNAEKEFDEILLADATNIQFTAASVNNEGYTFLKKFGEFDKVVLIKIVSPGRGKIEDIPVNILTGLPKRIGLAIQQYPHMIEAYKSSGNILPPASKPVVVEKVPENDKVLKDAQEALKDMHPPENWHSAAPKTKITTQEEIDNISDDVLAAFG